MQDLACSTLTVCFAGESNCLSIEKWCTGAEKGDIGKDIPILYLTQWKETVFTVNQMENAQEDHRKIKLQVINWLSMGLSYAQVTSSSE